jgi:hypothetical protein
VRRIPLLLAVLVLTACHSYHDDLYTICNAQRLSGLPPGSGVASVAEWTSEHIHTSRARDLMQSLSSRNEGLSAFAEEIRANEVGPCPILDSARGAHPEQAKATVATTSGTAALPAEVTEFVNRWDSCWHWQGEARYDDARRKQIEQGAESSCRGNEETRSDLIQKYAADPVAQKALQDLDKKRPPVP